MCFFADAVKISERPYDEDVFFVNRRMRTGARAVRPIGLSGSILLNVSCHTILVSGCPQGSFVGVSEGHQFIGQGVDGLTNVSRADFELDLLIESFSTFGCS